MIIFEDDKIKGEDTEDTVVDFVAQGEKKPLRVPTADSGLK
jgi:hypothetical protein